MNTVKTDIKTCSAFAWTKGNFIESKIAEADSNLNVKHKKDKAGLTWDYLQFIYEDTKKLFLIKNAAYFNENNFSQAVLPNKKQNREHHRTYLHELSKINQSLEFPSYPYQENTAEYNEQLSLFIPESLEN